MGEIWYSQINSVYLSKRTVMNVIETFLRLTGRTYPHGSEKELFGLLPDFLEHDEFGNRYFQIGVSTTCMFTSHLDTATSQKVDVVHVIEDGICKTDGKSILGADDKAGVSIMLWMIHHGIPGLYYFFVGEEVGCVGSKALADKIRANKIEGITKVISFDRRGKDSVITYQAGSRCCSDAFARALAGQLNKRDGFEYAVDPTGVWTDSAQFTRIYPECTNISVGYRSEHTCSESQDLNHLSALAEACLAVDWESLPVERDPSVTEYRTYGGYSQGYSSYGYSSYGSGSYSRGQRYSGYSGSGWHEDDDDAYATRSSRYDETKYFWDEKHNYVSSVTFEWGSKKVRGIDLDHGRLEDEKDLIADLLESLDVDYTQFTWDGMTLSVYHADKYTEVPRKTDRADLVEFIPELDFWRQAIEEKGKVSHDAWDTNPWSDRALVY